MKNLEIYNEDSYRKIWDLQQRGVLVDHIITDPPYNISAKNNFKTMASASRQGVDFGEWDKTFDLYSWIPEYAKLLKKGGTFIIFTSYRYISYVIAKLEETNNIVVKDIIKWIKSNPMPRNINRRYVQDTEYAIWAVKKGEKWVFNKPMDTSYLRAEFHTATVSGNERTKHPTQKSLMLMKDIIKIHTNINESILDPFMGSGTTGVAAINLDRKFIGIEIDKEYYSIAEKRIRDETTNVELF